MGKGLETILSVDNIRVKAYHGWYREERVIGGSYSISVKMQSECDPDDDFHSLESSINYELIYHTVLEVMNVEFRLIEDACKHIFDKLKSLAPQNNWQVRLVKEHPPLKFVEQTSFTIRG